MLSSSSKTSSAACRHGERQQAATHTCSSGRRSAASSGQPACIVDESCASKHSRQSSLVQVPNSSLNSMPFAHLSLKGNACVGWKGAAGSSDVFNTYTAMRISARRRRDGRGGRDVCTAHCSLWAKSTPQMPYFMRGRMWEFLFEALIGAVGVVVVAGLKGGMRSAEGKGS